VDHFSQYFCLYVRNIKKSEDDIPVPPLLKTAALWGMPSLFRFALSCQVYCLNMILKQAFGVHELVHISVLSSSSLLRTSKSFLFNMPHPCFTNFTVAFPVPLIF
jgi:hypothetical protein